jgi:hypothetical protein
MQDGNDFARAPGDVVGHRKTQSLADELVGTRSRGPQERQRLVSVGIVDAQNLACTSEDCLDA